MVRGPGPENERFLLHLERIQERAGRAQRQITSGYRLEKPSDAPAQMADIVELHTRIAASTQALTNLQSTQTEVDLNEASIRQAVDMLQDIVVAGTQGVSATATPEERKLLAERIREWHSSLVRIANQDYSGRFQFGGDRDDIPPYSVDWTQPGGVVRAHNAPNTRLIEDAMGNRFSVSRRAQDIFDLRDSTDGIAPENVFNAVYTLANALDANDAEAAIDAVGMVKNSALHLNNELSAFGLIQNHIKDAIDQARQVQLRATAQLAGIRETDLPAAVLELTQANTSLEAALSAQAHASHASLFDYLG